MINVEMKEEANDSKRMLMRNIHSHWRFKKSNFDMIINKDFISDLTVVEKTLTKSLKFSSKLSDPDEILKSFYCRWLRLFASLKSTITLKNLFLNFRSSSKNWSVIMNCCLWINSSSLKLKIVLKKQKTKKKSWCEQKRRRRNLSSEIHSISSM